MDSPGETHLPHPATPSTDYLLTIRSRKQRLGRIQTSDKVKSHLSIRADVLMCHIARNQEPVAWVTSTYVTFTNNQNGQTRNITQDLGSYTIPLVVLQVAAMHIFMIPSLQSLPLR